MEVAGRLEPLVKANSDVGALSRTLCCTPNVHALCTNPELRPQKWPPLHVANVGQGYSLYIFYN